MEENNTIPNISPVADNNINSELVNINPVPSIKPNFNHLDTGKKNLILVILFLIIMAAVAVYYFFVFKKQEVREKTFVEKQLEELERIRANRTPLTPDQVQSQQKELNEIKQTQALNSLTSEQIQKQKEELERIKSSQ